MEMRLAPVARGLLTYLPALNDLLPSKSIGHTESPAYCYGVWMKHLTLLHAHGLREIPRTIAELGPGETLGVGICGLLSGANHYVGLDVVAYSNPEGNLRILEGLLPLFRDRAPNPDKGWPNVNGWLDERQFPSHVLTPELLARTLAPERIATIRRAVSVPGLHEPVTAEYRAPWSDPGVIRENSIDLVISHSTLEHVVDLRGTYRALYQWLKPGGWMSHQIDFKSHGLTRRWNGFRACSEPVWKLALGRRPYMINREPGSVHLRLMQEAGFELVTHEKYFRKDGIRREELAPRWADISEEDLNCAGLYVMARK